MSPTVFRENGYRFFFFSREEERMHVHNISGDGEAKYWLESEIDVDLTLESIENPDQFPLKAKPV